MPKRDFLIFWFFFIFFEIFLARFEYERKSGRKFFFPLFFSLSTPVLARNNSGKRFFNFLIFFSIFFEILFPRMSMNGIRDKIFFHSFSAYVILFWLKIMPERGFLIFLLFFSEFSSPGRIWTEFGTKIFFSFSRPISSRFG